MSNALTAQTMDSYNAIHRLRAMVNDPALWQLNERDIEAVKVAIVALEAAEESRFTHTKH